MNFTSVTGKMYVLIMILFTAEDQYRHIKDGYYCVDETLTLSFPYKDYTFKDGSNATFLLKLYNFQTPFIFKVSCSNSGLFMSEASVHLSYYIYLL